MEATDNFTHFKILGVRIDDLSEATLTEILSNWLQQITTRLIVTPNPEFVLLAQKDLDFRSLLNTADLCLPDGVGLRFAVAALDHQYLKYRHTGVETLSLLAKLCAKYQQRLMLLGGSPKKTERAAVKLRQQYPGLEVDIFDPGIIDGKHVILSEATLAGVGRLKPQVIAVALGQGKQERVMQILKDKLPGLKILIGIGGAVDYLSGLHQRAPAVWQRLGFEWLWRLTREPWRLKRILNAVILFPLHVIWASFKSGRLLGSCKFVIKAMKIHFKT
jgi:N-acetylglucosaminyldiphosphoundecaprenol N-acetyl-beta-D-mannosaminyltransferase